MKPFFSSGVDGQIALEAAADGAINA